MRLCAFPTAVTHIMVATLAQTARGTCRHALRQAASPHSRSIIRRGLATTTGDIHPAGSGSRSASHRIVVVGGGTAGQAASHQLLRTGVIKDAADILLIDPSTTHDYQPGWTLVGAGLKTKEELRRPMEELIGEDNRLVLLQDAVETFDPEQNKLKTRDGRAISYEHLIVCPGLGIQWGGVKGLEDRLKEGRNVSSIYSYVRRLVGLWWLRYTDLVLMNDFPSRTLAPTSIPRSKPSPRAKPSSHNQRA